MTTLLTIYFIGAVAVACITQVVLFFLTSGTGRYAEEEDDLGFMRFWMGVIAGILWPLLLVGLPIWFTVRATGTSEAKH